MTNHNIKNEIQAPSKRKLVVSSMITIVSALIILVVVVLPAEYGIDLTGLGNAAGLTSLNEPTRTIVINDVIGGNTKLRELEIPDFGEPVPLPNPAVFQDEPNPPVSRILEITIPAESSTEIKVYLNEGKAIVYSWEVDQGDIYVDYHGHDPALGDDFWVRYKEQQEGSGNNGSLTAPFSGEHGWYWLNYNEFPVVVTLTVTGFFDDLIDYGIF